MPTGKSSQHNMLLSLDNGSNEVYYVAPLFDTQDEFNKYYLNGSILRNSVFIRPSTIGPLPDDLEHHVSIDPHLSSAYRLSSSPKKIEAPRSGTSFTEYLVTGVAKEKHTTFENLLTLYAHLVDIANRRYGYRSGLARGGGIDAQLIINDLSYLARYVLSSEIILIGRAN